MRHKVVTMNYPKATTAHRSAMLSEEWSNKEITISIENEEVARDALLLFKSGSPDQQELIAGTSRCSKSLEERRNMLSRLGHSLRRIKSQSNFDSSNGLEISFDKDEASKGDSRRAGLCSSRGISLRNFRREPGSPGPVEDITETWRMEDTVCGLEEGAPLQEVRPVICVAERRNMLSKLGRSLRKVKSFDEAPKTTKSNEFKAESPMAMKDCPKSVSDQESAFEEDTGRCAKVPDAIVSSEKIVEKTSFQAVHYNATTTELAGGLSREATAAEFKRVSDIVLPGRVKLEKITHEDIVFEADVTPTHNELASASLKAKEGDISGAEESIISCDKSIAHSSEQSLVPSNENLDNIAQPEVSSPVHTPATTYESSSFICSLPQVSEEKSLQGSPLKLSRSMTSFRRLGGSSFRNNKSQSSLLSFKEDEPWTPAESPCLLPELMELPSAQKNPIIGQRHLPTNIAEQRPLLHAERKTRFSRLGRSLRRMRSQTSIECSFEDSNISEQKVRGANEGKARLGRLGRSFRRKKSVALQHSNEVGNQPLTQKDRKPKLLRLGKSFRKTKSQRSISSTAISGFLAPDRSLSTEESLVPRQNASLPRLGQSFRTLKSHRSIGTCLGEGRSTTSISGPSVGTERDARNASLSRLSHSFRTLKSYRSINTCFEGKSMTSASPSAGTEDAFVATRRGKYSDFRRGIRRARSYNSHGSSMEKTPCSGSTNHVMGQELYNPTKLEERKNVLTMLQAKRANASKDEAAGLVEEQETEDIKKAIKASLSEGDHCRPSKAVLQRRHRRSRSHNSIESLEKTSTRKNERLAERRSVLTRLGRNIIGRHASRLSDTENRTVAASTDEESLPSQARKRKAADAKNCPRMPVLAQPNIGDLHGARSRDLPLSPHRRVVQIPAFICIDISDSSEVESLGFESVQTASGDGDEWPRFNTPANGQRADVHANLREVVQDLEVPSIICVDSSSVSFVESLGDGSGDEHEKKSDITESQEGEDDEEENSFHVLVPADGGRENFCETASADQCDTDEVEETE